MRLQRTNHRGAVAVAMFGGLAVLMLTGSRGDAAGDASRWWSHVQYLAADDLQGRDTGSEDHRKAVEYVADQFKKAGLEPAGTNGYLQPVSFHSRRLIEEQSGVALVRDGKAEPLTLGEDVNISMRVEPAATLEAPMVFVGYGLTVPEMNYDDLAGLDLTGKVAVFVSGGPSNIPGPLLAHFQSTGVRWSFLQRAGAIGTLSFQNPRNMDIPWERATLSRLQPAMSLADPKFNETAGQKISLTGNPAHADKLLAGSGHTFAKLMEIANAGQPLPRFGLSPSLRAHTRFESAPVQSDNVAAVWRGTASDVANEYVVLSAHVDHLGVGKPIKDDTIYNGAMDNASGVATLLELTARFAESNRRFRRPVLFLATTAEEKGLLGSRYFAETPTVGGTIVANLNLDMFLPLFPMKIVMALGVDESDLGDILRSVAAPRGVIVQSDPEPLRNRFTRSDQYNFIRRGVPALAFKIGYQAKSPEADIAARWTRERYHAPSDDLRQPVDLKAADDFNGLMAELLAGIADRPVRPEWKGTSFFKRFAASRNK